ncbi:hypothetical protein [Kutzneria sp. NPDC052558]|uniref:hypothetical protein n=1 Tax=Kutzneria sp. NPDC052558 TaxID=3364121 RepID=UPI0037C705A3
MTQPPVPGPPPTTGRSLPTGPRAPMWPADGAGGTTPHDTPMATIDYAVARLAELDTLDVAEHPARFEAVHATLTDALSAIDGF